MFAGATLDPEKLLWVSDKKLISIPKAPFMASFMEIYTKDQIRQAFEFSLSTAIRRFERQQIINYYLYREGVPANSVRL